MPSGLAAPPICRSATIPVGFDSRITAATHGGCMRLLAASGSGITKLEDLKGKTVGVWRPGSC